MSAGGGVAALAALAIVAVALGGGDVWCCAAGVRCLAAAAVVRCLGAGRLSGLARCGGGAVSACGGGRACGGVGRVMAGDAGGRRRRWRRRRRMVSAVWRAQRPGLAWCAGVAAALALCGRRRAACGVGGCAAAVQCGGVGGAMRRAVQCNAANAGNARRRGVMAGGGCGGRGGCQRAVCHGGGWRDPAVSWS